MDYFINQLIGAFSLIKTNMPEALLIVSGFWLIHLINMIIGYRLNILGLYPRHIRGLLGIPFFSFLHSDFNHLFFNSIPLIVLIDFILLGGMQKLLCVSVTIILISGILLWLIGRHAIHIGASCLVMGYWGYLLVNAYQHPSAITIVLAIVCLYYFGGLLCGFFPNEERVSWEGHIFGFLGGIAALFICP